MTLKISERQLTALRRQAERDHRDQLGAHIRAAHPASASACGPYGVAALVDLAIARAAERGFDTVATVQSWADHMVLFGAFFDEDPLMTDVIEPLEDRMLVSALARMDAVHARAMALFDRMSGPGGGAALQAAARMNAWASASDATLPAAPDAVKTLFERIFPEKAAAHAPCVDAAIRRAALMAGAHGFDDPAGRGVVALIALMAGSGVLDDPMFRASAPDLPAAVAGTEDRAERVALLRAAAVGWLTAALAAARDVDGRAA
jgi:hypothetical protein